MNNQNFVSSSIAKTALRLCLSVLLASPALVQAATCVPGVFSNPGLGLISDNGDSVTNLTVRWDVCDSIDGKTLQMEVSAITTGWVGIGFVNDPNMNVMATGNTDMIMGGVLTDGTTYISDRLTQGFTSPAVDIGQNVTLNSATEIGGVTTYEFTRLLNTGDTAGDFDLSTGSYFLAWAFHPISDDTTQFHYNAADPSFGRSVSAVSFVPVPAAVWLFGSGLLGLVGVARRKA